MRYKTITIDVNSVKRVWTYTISTLPGDYKREKRVPLALGDFSLPGNHG